MIAITNKQKAKKIYLENKGKKTNLFTTPHSRLNKIEAEGTVCGYGIGTLIVKLNKSEGWQPEVIRRTETFIFIEEESDDKDGHYWFILEEDLIIEE